MLSPDRMESVTLIELGPALCGYPGVIHGGISATILDEAMGRLATAALVGPKGHDADGDGGERPVTARLEMRYLKPVKVEKVVEREPEMPWLEERSGALVKVEAWVERCEKERGKVWVAAEVRGESLEGRVRGEVVLVEAQALFVVPRGYKPEKIVEELK